MQAVAGNLAAWICLPLGAGLWTAAVIAAVTLFWDAYLILVHYGPFIRTIFSFDSSSELDAAREIRPLQRRIAAQTITLWLASLFTLVMFHYHGPAAAGRMGMTWTALTALHRGALAWVYARAPRFGVLVAQGKFDELDRIFMRVATVSFALRALGGAAFFGLVVALNHTPHWLAARIAERLLPPLALLPFVAAVVLDHLPSAQTIYARAHKREPYFGLSLVSNGLLIFLVWLMGKGELGAFGAGIADLAVTAGFVVPAWSWVCLRTRRAWR
jgi:hypothetical protein